MIAEQGALTDWQVVILRSESQAALLAALIQAEGGVAQSLPLLEIVPLDIDSEQLKRWESDLARCDLLVVSSANAIQCAPQPFLTALASQKRMIVTMGEATAQALQAEGINPTWIAPPGATSETLLQQSFFASIKMIGQTVGLLAGEAGRGLIAETLAQRGAELCWFKTYRTRCATFSIDPFLVSWKKQSRLCFIAPSERTLMCLWHKMPANDRAWLQQCPLIVVSPRIARCAAAYGFQAIHTASDPFPASLLSTLLTMGEVCDTRV